MLKELTVVAMLVTGDDPNQRVMDVNIALANFYYFMLHQTNDQKAFHERFLKKRWGGACKTESRLVAMAEAYQMGRPNPCNGAKVWKR